MASVGPVARREPPALVRGWVTGNPSGSAHWRSAVSGAVGLARTGVSRLRRSGRPRWWQELAFVAVCYLLYSLVRDGVPGRRADALRRAVSVLHLERWLHIDPELAVNRWLAHLHWLAIAANYYYATLHFAVTVGVLVWVYRQHPQRYRAARTALFAVNGLALLGFWLFPLAPPRMLGQFGFVDTISQLHTWGSWDSAAVAKASNQFAAMPSLHIGWALWSAVVVVVLARRRWVKVLAACYPVCTLLVILGTANHFLLDAVGGAVTVGLALLVQRLLYGHWLAERRPAATSLPHRTRPVDGGVGGRLPIRGAGQPRLVGHPRRKPATNGTLISGASSSGK